MYRSKYSQNLVIYYETMRLTISSDVLKQQGLTLKDFGVLLYYAGGGHGNIVPNIGDKLWNMNLLVKTTDGFEFNHHATKRIEEWSETSTIRTAPTDKRFLALADQLRALYPEGRKQGTAYAWRDTTITIAKKLKTLCEKFGCTFTDEEAIDATKRYVASFNGNYHYMQLLKYFILKKDNEKMEESSQLLNFIQNVKDDEDDPFMPRDIGELV